MDEIINLKAKTFDIIMTKTRLVEELNALDRFINENVRKIQELEQQKISSERQIEVPSSEVLNQNIEEEAEIPSEILNQLPETKSIPLKDDPPPEVLNQDIEEENIIPPEINSQPPPNQSESPSNNHVNLIPIEEEIPPQKKN